MTDVQGHDRALAVALARMLAVGGHQALFVGGAVRNPLVGRVAEC